MLATPPLNVYEHMALDEITVLSRPAETTLRFYHWTSGPAVTFGYAQPLRAVQALVNARGKTFQLTRRPTGGGVVFHEDDLTFSLVFVAPGRPAEIYARFHALIQQELRQVSPQTFGLEGAVSKERYRPATTAGASACFTNPVANDLLADNGTKILGGALRRFGNTVLYQGSLQLPHARENPIFKRAIIEAVRKFLVVDLRPDAVSIPLLGQAKQRALSLYQTTDWLEKF